MSLFITSLNSGSNGNCYYIANQNEAVLIDVGISCRETVKRMARLGLSMEKVKAIFISHEHSDHIRGVAVLSSKFKLPVYITDKTFRNSGLNLDINLIKTFTAYNDVTIGGLSVKAFPKLHDAADPYSFIVSGNGVNIGVLTDIGSACHHVINNFKNCHAAFLEANYDEEMLENGGYPFFLKRRIRGGHGHLSNAQSLNVFINYKPEFMSHVILSHLSRENNSPQLVEKLFLQHCGSTAVIVASRDYETPLYEITPNAGSSRVIEEPPIVIQATLF